MKDLVINHFQERFSLSRREAVEMIRKIKQEYSTIYHDQRLDWLEVEMEWNRVYSLPGVYLRFIINNVWP